MDVREKLVELLWEYDQMRMMRMSIEECADRLITKGLTVRKYENDTKCSDFAICLDENAKQKTERIVDLMTSFYGVDPGYYGVEAYPLASHLIAHGVTVQEWISVKDRLPEKDIRVLVWMQDNEEGYTQIDTDRFSCTMEQGYHWIRWGKCVTHWMPLPKSPEVKND